VWWTVLWCVLGHAIHQCVLGCTIHQCDGQSYDVCWGTLFTNVWLGALFTSVMDSAMMCAWAHYSPMCAWAHYSPVWWTVPWCMLGHTIHQCVLGRAIHQWDILSWVVQISVVCVKSNLALSQLEHVNWKSDKILNRVWATQCNRDESPPGT
jgi:hypothetical protein